jgi:hypothetical protein
MAYTDATAIAGYLGLTLTSPQQTQAGTLAAAATAWIDRYTGRSWQQASPVTDELQEIVGDAVWLDNRPVTAVSSVKTRQQFADAGSTTLDASQWELIDAANGKLLIQGFSDADLLAVVSYTHAASSAPDDVELAATMIAAAWLSQALRPSTEGLDSISVGQNDVSVKFSANRGDVPPAALSILNGYRRVVIA